MVRRTLNLSRLRYGKEWCFSGSHSPDVLHEQHGVFLGEVVAEESDFHDRLMAEEVQVKR